MSPPSRFAPGSSPPTKSRILPGGRTVFLLLTLLLLGGAAVADERSAEEPIRPLPAVPNQDPRRVSLGEQLFQDGRLAHDDKRSCGSCHDTRTNGASANASRFDMTPKGEPLPVTTPSVFNAALNFRMDWEGDFRSLEDEVEGAMLNPDIMASSFAEAIAKLKADPKTVARFQEAYGHGPDRQSILDAMAAYERTLLTPGSRFDRWLEGDASALTPLELQGYQLFKSLGCSSCHQGANVGGNLFERHGIFHPLGRPEPLLVRVPSLRNIAAMAPYFHDGSASTLPLAVREMGVAQLDRFLTEDQVAAIVAFLHTLTGSYRGHEIAPATGATGAARP